jgi:hypothetical protein
MKTPTEINEQMHHYNSLITQEIIDMALIERSRRKPARIAKTYEKAARFTAINEQLEDK